jgi:hypothetical protein
VSIRQFLDGQQFDPDTILVLGLAFEMARASTKVLNRPEITEAAIAMQIVALARSGERSPDELCDGRWQNWARRRDPGRPPGTRLPGRR